MVLPDSDRVSRVPPYSGTISGGQHLSNTGLSPSMACLSSAVLLGPDFVTPRYCWSSTRNVLQPRNDNASRLTYITVWAIPASLAATKGIAIAFSSSGYLDGSVPRVGAFATGLDPS